MLSACSSDVGSENTGTVAGLGGPYDVTFSGTSNISSKGYTPAVTTGAIGSTGMVMVADQYSLTIKSEFKQGANMWFLSVGATGLGKLEPGTELRCLISFDESIDGVALRRWAGSAKIRYESLQNQRSTFSFTDASLNPRGGAGNDASGNLRLTGKLSYQSP
jgi:hypothetical protein